MQYTLSGNCFIVERKIGDEGLTGRELFSDRLGLGLFATYGVFLLGFFFFPERPLHYKFYDIAVLLPGLFLLHRELPLLWKAWPSRLLLLWLCYQLLSALWSHSFAFMAFATLFGWWLQVLVFIVVTASLSRRYQFEFEFLLKVLATGVALSALVSIYSWYTNPAHPSATYRLEPIGRIDNAILAGCAYGIFTLLALHFSVASRTIWARVLYVSAFLVLVSAVFLTHSRTAILGLLAALVAMPLCFGRRSLLATLSLLVGIFVVARFAFPEVLDRFYMTLHWRPLIWESVLARIADAPWFGYGYLSDTSVTVVGGTFQHAHSSYLGFLRDGGLVGMAIFVTMVAGFGGHIIQRGCGKAAYLIPMLVFALMVIAPDVDRLIVRPRELWLFFWWPLAMFVGMNQLGTVSDATSAS